MTTSFQSSQLAQPSSGSRAVTMLLDFTAGSNIVVDLTQEMEVGKLEFIQSVWIDNADNASVCDLIFNGAPIPQRIRAQANTQGWYPVEMPVGAIRLTGASNSGSKINVIFANHAMPYIVYGPPSGITVVPPLTNKPLNALNFPGAGDQQLVAGVAGQTVKLYRGIFSVDQPTVLTFTDGPGGAVLFAAQLTAGGSVTFQVSGVPWFNNGIGHDLTLHSSAACNVYGGFGYVQS